MAGQCIDATFPRITKHTVDTTERESMSLVVYATDTLCSDVTPSFVLMDVQGGHVTLYIYQLVEGEVKVTKQEFTKER